MPTLAGREINNWHRTTTTPFALSFGVGLDCSLTQSKPASQLLQPADEMPKDGGAPTFISTAKLHSTTSCFETRPLLATLVALGLITFLWNIQPYRDSNNLISSNPNSTAIFLAESKIAAHADPSKRVFIPYGNAAALFVQMGAYRGGPDTFAVIGLASKPIHVFGRPWYKCKWLSNNNGTVFKSKSYKMLPDWGYGRVYTVVVVNCTFPNGNPNADNSGGKLILQAYYDRNPKRFEKIVAMEELPGAYNETKYTPPYDYEYLYCGSSLYGEVNAARMREWMAYHAWFFGAKSHFVFHDAGGVSAEVMAALEPWVRAGRVTVQDIRDQSEYDGYYYNQFLIVNDCLHRYRYAANWTFFFDVDEYIYLPDGWTLESVLGELASFTQFTIEQNPMSSSLCLNNESHSSEWGFEKLVFREARTGIRRDRKYAIQAKYAYSTGVHMSENVTGNTTHNTESMIRYFHYHNTITIPGELCRDLLPDTAKTNTTWRNELPYVYDDRMKQLAPTVKRFEQETLNGSQPQGDS